jgi:hypothetical protein
MAFDASNFDFSKTFGGSGLSLNVLVFENGKRVDNDKLGSNFISAILQFEKIALDINMSKIMSETLDEIRRYVSLDTLNIANARARRDGGEPDLTHIISGKLFKSIDVKRTSKSNDSAEYDFGYFVDYGLNLEKGTPNTKAYPIITRVWNNDKNLVFNDTVDAIYDKFKEAMRDNGQFI